MPSPPADPDKPSDSRDDFDLQIERLKATNPGEAVWMAIGNLAGQVSTLRHDQREDRTRFNALKIRLIGDPDDKEDHGLLGEIKAEIEETRFDLRQEIQHSRAEVHAIYALGKWAAGILAVVIAAVLAAAILGHVRIIP